MSLNRDGALSFSVNRLLYTHHLQIFINMLFMYVTYTHHLQIFIDKYVIYICYICTFKFVSLSQYYHKLGNVITFYR